MNRGLDPLAAANLILRAAKLQKRSLTHLKLQKILYFTHAICLVQKRRPLIDGEFEAWQYGPVCREVYSEFKRYGSDELEGPIAILDPVSGREMDFEEDVDTEISTTIDSSVDFFGKLSAGQLVELSHSKDGPWDQVVRNAEYSVNMGMRIKNEVIIRNFRSHWLNSDMSRSKEIEGEDSPFAAH